MSRKTLYFITALFFLMSTGFSCNLDPLNHVPVLYNGRYIPMQTYARLWLKDLGLKEQKNPLKFMLKLHFFGKTFIENKPLIPISKREIKQILGNKESSFFSLNELNDALLTSKEKNLALISPLISSSFQETYKKAINRKKIELHQLSPQLFVTLNNYEIQILSSPDHAPWHFLEKKQIIGPYLTNNKKQKQIGEEVSTMLYQLQTLNRLQEEPEKELLHCCTTFLALPGKGYQNSWHSLKALHLPLKNFTAYPDAIFDKVKNSYLNLQTAMKKGTVKNEAKELADALLEGYQTVQASSASPLPSKIKLQTENLFYQIPFTSFLIAAYTLSVTLLLLYKSKKGKLLLYLTIFIASTSFLTHTLNLLLRSYLLSRPPVSNMAETVVFVPWIAILSSLFLAKIYRTTLPLILSFLAAAILFLILKLSQTNTALENVQPVLNSQFWLTIHVLLVVGSYGAFVLSGLLAHLYLIFNSSKQLNIKTKQKIGRLMLQSIFIGLAMLIPGTILGGVWAAQSWGRFWDWDPKESWAFITCCVYLFCVHGYYFNLFSFFGLAIGSIFGLMVTGFTWYGVNYILGSGLHSYGFGSGGEDLFYIYLILELIFIAFFSILGYNCSARKR